MGYFSRLRRAFAELRTPGTVQPQPQYDPALPLAHPEITALRASLDLEITRAAAFAFQQGALWTQINERMSETRAAVSEGIDRAERIERRIKSVVARAQKDLAQEGLSDPALDAEATQLQLVNGDGSETEELPAVQEVVGGPGPYDEAALIERLRRAKVPGYEDQTI